MKPVLFCEALNNKLVHQFPKGIHFAYDIHLGHSRDPCKGISYYINSENVLHHAFGNGGKLAHQIYDGISFTYNLCLGRSRGR